MALMYFGAALCLLLVAQRAATIPDHRDLERHIKRAIDTITYSSHLPQIAEREDIPHFHLESLLSLPDNDEPCGDRYTERYRRVDGVCNNFRKPFQGAVMDTELRLFSNYYLDGHSFPRVQGIDNYDLPGAREVSLKCFDVEEDDDGPGSLKATQLVWQFGQFIAHDMTLLERFKEGITCCDNFDRTMPYEMLFHGDGLCFPIEVPPNDPFFNETCMVFTRSFAVDVFGVREPVNGITSYIDASTVYGSSNFRAGELREFSQGLLKANPGTGIDQLPNFDDYPCTPSAQLPHCHGSGDTRLSDHPGLISLHTMFHADHNRIARRLFRLNRHWDDERIYQESRKIIAAFVQKLLYDDHLPQLLGDDVMRVFRLNAPYAYDEGIDASAITEFTTTAQRFGHSMINTRVENVEISKTYFKPTTPEKTHTVPFYMAHHNSLINDHRFSSQVRDRMYEDVPIGALTATPGPSFDLPALNIQRARELGVPPYTVVRDACMKLMHGVEGLQNNTPACMHEGTYRHEEDVDLFVGGMTEKPLPNAILGPTFACLTALQFQRLRFGDRFFYETEGPEGFTQEQRDFIKRNTMSSIICELNPEEYIQRDSFRPVTDDNPLVPCKTILEERNLDEGLAHWKETTHSDAKHPLFSPLASCSSKKRKYNKVMMTRN